MIALINYLERRALVTDRYGIATSLNYLRHTYLVQSCRDSWAAVDSRDRSRARRIALLAYHFDVLGL
jgi:hypothetical protein